MADGGIYCFQCKKDRPAKLFIDAEGRYSRRCSICRDAEDSIETGRQTPHSRKASGQISSDEVKRLLEEREREEAAEADTLRPPPPDDPEEK